jgi:magnesium transporter
VADLLEELGREEREMIVRTLGPEAAADALEEAEEEVQAAVISQLDPEVAADILEEMDPGEAADILTSIPDAHSEEIMEEVEAPERAQLEQLIAYEEKTAAALMTPEFISVSPTTTVAEALEEVRRQASEIEGIYYVYVLEHEILVGVTTLRTLFRSPSDAPMRRIMETRLVTVQPTDEPREVAEAFQKYSFLGCPVVDEDGRMLGVILLKHAFDELLPEFRREARA